MKVIRYLREAAMRAGDYQGAERVETRPSTWRSAFSRFGYANEKPVSIAFSGLRRALVRSNGPAISPSAIRRAAPGTGNTAGRFRTRARIAVNSAFVTASGEAALTAPRTASVITM